MAIDCTGFRQMMHDALDGSLDAGGREAFDGHLATCDACRTEFEALERSLELFTALPDPGPGPEFAAEVVTKARAARRAQARSQQVWVIGLLVASLATGAAAAAAGAGILLPRTGDAVTGLWHGLVWAWSLVMALVTSLGGILEILVPIAEIVAGIAEIGSAIAQVLAWEKIIVLTPTYVMALVLVIATTLLSRVRRPAASLPALSI